ncbi:TRAP transporter substrate-binding protein [Cytobacillus oceanisediminis]
MKRRIFVLAIASALTLAACGGGAQDGDSVELSLGSAAAPTNAMTPSAEQFKKDVEEGTDGRVKVVLQLNGVVGDEATMSEAVQRGTLEAGIISDFGLSAVEPKISVAGLPYLFRDMDEVKEHYYAGFIGEYNSKQLAKKDIKVLAWGDNSFRALSNSKRPVNGADDIKGLNLRVTPVPVLVDFFEALGAKVTPLPITEVLTALQQGLVDGQENGINLTASFGFGDVQKHMTVTNHSYSAVGYVINSKIWDSISAEDQAVVQKAAEDAAAFEIEQNIKDVETNRAKLEDAGVTFDELDAASVATLRAEAQKVWAEYEDDFDAEILDQIDATLGSE